ncbi:MAG: alpha-amylase family glycosyl hydrolase [Thermoanaerobaculia bacterium]
MLKFGPSTPQNRGFPRSDFVRRAFAGLALLTALVGGCVSTPAPQPAAGAPAGPKARPLLSDWSDAVLYFVVVDRYADGDPANNVAVDRSAKGAFHGGDFKGLTAQLDEIAALGVNAIWVTPVVRNIPGFVSGAGFPDWAYHGYWADDFTALDPRFGTEAEIRSFVDACHTRGIRVLLDVVYNHAGYGSRYTTDPKTRGWLRTEEAGTCGKDDLTSCVSGLPDFRTERPEVADYLLTAQIGWAKRLGVDGFRLDTVKHVSHAFWQEHRRRTRETLGKDFFLLGEVWGGDREVLDPWFAGDELDAGFDFGFAGSTIGWLKGRGRTVAFDRYLKSREKVRPGHLLAHFLSSHDVSGALFQLEGDKELFRLAAVLQMTTAGIPTIYYGEEVGRAGGEWPENRSDMPWGDRKILPGEGKPRDEALRGYYLKVVAARNAHPALRRGAYETLSTEGDLLVFLKRDAPAKDAVVVAVNRGKEPAVARFASPPEWSGLKVRDLLGRDAPVPVTGDRVEFTLAPRTAVVLSAGGSVPWPE